MVRQGKGNHHYARRVGEGSRGTRAFGRDGMGRGNRQQGQRRTWAEWRTGLHERGDLDDNILRGGGSPFVNRRAAQTCCCTRAEDGEDGTAGAHSGRRV